MDCFFSSFNVLWGIGLLVPRSLSGPVPWYSGLVGCPFFWGYTLWLYTLFFNGGFCLLVRAFVCWFALPARTSALLLPEQCICHKNWFFKDQRTACSRANYYSTCPFQQPFCCLSFSSFVDLPFIIFYIFPWNPSMSFSIQATIAPIHLL